MHPMRPTPVLGIDSNQFIENLFSARLTRLEDTLPLLGRIEEVSISINKSLLDIKDDLKEVKGEVSCLHEGQQGLLLNFQTLSSKVVSLETIESDRKERRKTVLKAVLTTAGTVAAAIVIWYFGLK
jgi:hypothetical protein